MENALSSQFSHRLKIALPGVNKITTEFLDNIYYCEADDCYSRLFLKNKEHYLTTYSLGKLEQSLTSYNIIRCHHSYMVNILHVKEIDKKRNIAILDNNAEIPISQSNRKKLIEHLYRNAILIS